LAGAALNPEDLIWLFILWIMPLILLPVLVYGLIKKRKSIIVFCLIALLPAVAILIIDQTDLFRI
jgi:hypothetical protein